MVELNHKLGEMIFDGLISGTLPPVQIGGGKIGKLSEEGTIKRGTVLVKGEDGKLAVIGSGEGTPDCILCDDLDVGTEDDETVAVYTAGCFDPDFLTVADGYTLTDADIDALRIRGIVLKNKTNL